MKRSTEPCAVRRVRIEKEGSSVSLTSDDAQGRLDEAQGRPGDEAQGRLVLLVTDDADLRLAGERALQREGFRVATAAHGGHALLACLGATRVDVLVTELWMRDMSGPALAERVRRYFPDLPVVYVAISGTPECEGVLVRPFTRDDLVRQIDLTLAGAIA